MATLRPVCAALVGLGLLAGGCGESQDVPSRFDQVLGDTKEGAPLVRGALDKGILVDASTYQSPRAAGPAAVSRGGGGEGPGATPARPTARTTDAQVAVSRDFTQLVQFAHDGLGENALRMFNKEHVQLLTEKLDVIAATFDKVELLRLRVAKLSGEDKADKLLEPLRPSPPADQKIELVDAEHASITPNPLMVFFGPSRTTPALRAALVEGEWKFELEQPLTAEDVAAIEAYHQQLQATLDQIDEWLAGAAGLDEAQLQGALTKAVQGEPVELGAPAEGAPAAEPNAAPAGPGMKGVRPPGT
ncbi:MAG: hypothetical protein AB1716_15165 [Planctomycetota bacterium]